VTEGYSVHPEIKQKISSLFLQSIQLQDNFLTIENIKKALLLLISENVIPTIFLLRFDRMKQAATPEFFNNLQGLIAATHNNLALVFTSDRPLDQIRPDIFSREELTTFSHLHYLLPAQPEDAKIIFRTIQNKYNIEYPTLIENELLRISGGHMQYLYLIHTILQEQFHRKKNISITSGSLFASVLSDERITLQSEEIFESLSSSEKSILNKLIAKNVVSSKKEIKYIFDSGIIQDNSFFSPLFEKYLETKTTVQGSIEFSKKEHLLYSFLKNNLDEICERDSIIHNVWPESEETGVSDWTIDRLVARVRQKLLSQKSEFSIITVKTRGYKLVQS
jgi:DNA-binding winged helix-turn-helix (wHTH) protein